MSDMHKSIWFGASLGLLAVGVALVAAFFILERELRLPGWVLVVGLVISVGAPFLTRWSAETDRQRRLARWLAIGIAVAITAGAVFFLIALMLVASALSIGSQ
jgi:hypothetical protein